MKWSEISSNPERRLLRQFGIAGLVILGAVAFRQYWIGHHRVAMGFGIAGGFFGIAGIIHPPLLRWIFVGWMKVAFPINFVVSELVLGIIFYAVLTPLALFFRLIGRDQLSLKVSGNPSSYWVKKPAAPDVRNYFRQH